MQRVRRNRCGYNGYTCVGLPQLKSPYRGVVVPCEDDGQSALLRQINDYQHLPMKFAGFVSRLDTIYDMDAALAYPEQTCVTCVNVFDDGTFFNMFDVYGPGKTYWWPGQPVYTGTFAGMVNFDPDYAEKGRPDNPDDPSSETCAKYARFSANSILLDNPLLDTLLETEFPPVSVDVIPAADHALDGAMFTLVQLTKWRTKVEKMLEDILAEINMMRIIRTLMLGLDMNSLCNNFRITETTGKFIADVDNRTFSVSNGTAVINGTRVDASGLSGLKAPFKVYLSVTFSNPDPTYGQYRNVTARLATSGGGGTISVQIGGATVVVDEISGYSAIRIQQAECDVVLDVIRTSKGGILYRTGGGASPYQAYTVGPCS